MNPHIFREYDIRGIVERDLDPATVRAVGAAFGTRTAEAGGRRIAVGRDVRETSPAVADALLEGLLSTGIDVCDLGMVPTPVLYHAVHTLGVDGGIQITGSHNPPEYNGMKLMLGKETLHGDSLRDLGRLAGAGVFRSGRGRREEADPIPGYLEDLARHLFLPRPLRIVVDAGNGCASLTAPDLLRRLGAEVDPLFCEPDGRFPNHLPDPTLPGTLTDLRARVLAGGFDFGLAFDGDADRLGALDDSGRIVWGDQLLALFAREILAATPGASILFEVKCSQALIEDIEAHGGVPVMTRTGHSLIKARMRELGSPLAGEMSGHLFFAEWYGIDDALYAGGRLARLVAESGRPLSAHVDTLPRFAASPEIRVGCPDERKFEVVEAIRARYRRSHAVVEVDGARVTFRNGWGLVRASNTEPMLVLRAEGRTEGERDGILEELRKALEPLGVSWPSTR